MSSPNRHSSSLTIRCIGLCKSSSSLLRLVFDPVDVTVTLLTLPPVLLVRFLVNQFRFDLVLSASESETTEAMSCPSTIVGSLLDVVL